ncbi:hypothetical protein HK100_007092 [Physocladia obscura]|uniref:Tubulin-specific chaperone A n=1 Tax=Physocladia obscura TaxID=109957 RepID=A0AAD5XF04_9FUNG|nr:hypothetical protein HK100_007092 [Physocladia obscura]
MHHGNLKHRLVKELNSYEKEHVAQQERIDKLVAAGEDAHTVRKQREVLEETTVMIPDCKNRIAVAKDELQRLVAEILASAAEAAESEEIIAAQEVIRNAPVKL